MDKISYPIVITAIDQEDGGGFVAYVPDLRGCMSDGATHEEAARNIVDAIREWIDEAEESGIPVPQPGDYARAAAEAWNQLAEVVKSQDKIIQELEGDLTNLRRRTARILESYCVEEDRWETSTRATSQVIANLCLERSFN